MFTNATNIEPITPEIPPCAELISFSDLTRITGTTPDFLRDKALSQKLEIAEAPFSRNCGMRISDLEKVVGEVAARSIRRTHRPGTFPLGLAAHVLGIPGNEILSLCVLRGVHTNQGTAHPTVDQNGLWLLGKMLVAERAYDPIEGDVIPAIEALEGLRRNQATINGADTFCQELGLANHDAEVIERCRWLGIRWWKGSVRPGGIRGLWSKPGIGVLGFDLWRLCGVKCKGSDIETYNEIMRIVREDVLSRVKLFETPELATA
jgi:hypothetical protein